MAYDHESYTVQGTWFQATDIAVGHIDKNKKEENFLVGLVCMDNSFSGSSEKARPRVGTWASR